MNNARRKEIIAQIITEPTFVDFGDVARGELQMQCQYASRYIRGRKDAEPALGEGLRFTHMDTGCYHDIKIHRDDVSTFVQRFKRHRAEHGGWLG
jgi:hypothetical protein